MPREWYHYETTEATYGQGFTDNEIALLDHILKHDKAAASTNGAALTTNWTQVEKRRNKFAQILNIPLFKLIWESPTYSRRRGSNCTSA